MKRPIVIGLGNPDRGDDAVGRVVAQILRSHAARRYDVVDAVGEATEILALLEGRENAMLVDACVSGAPAGTIHQIDLQFERAPDKDGAISSHGIGLAQAIGLARALDILPEHCLVYAIEAGAFEPGAAMTPAVAEAANRLVDRILAQLRD